MRVKWLRQTPGNLDEEAAYIAQVSRASAAAFVKHLTESATMLGSHPHMGRAGNTAIPGSAMIRLT